jgi:hypothetical protein
MDKFRKALRRTLDSKLTDVVTGPMTLKELDREIYYWVGTKSPEYVVILIEKRPELQKYHTTVYMKKEDFNKRVK